MAPERSAVWPDALESVLLAKSAAKGKGSAPESLAYHTWQVLKRLADFIRLRPALPARLERLSLWNCLYWAAFLHDFGKAMPPFQRLLRDDRSARAEWGKHRHELFSLAFVDWLAPGLGTDDLAWVAAAVVSHHRDRDELALHYPTPEPGDPDPVAEMLAGLPPAHVAGLYDWLASCGWPWAQHLGLDAFGVTPIPFPMAMPPFRAQDATRRVRHWLRQFKLLASPSGRSSADGFSDLITLRGMILSADHSGSADAPTLPCLALRPDDVVRKFGWDKVMPHQRGRNDDLPSTADPRALDWPKGSALLISPTGSGKTEAALLWATCQLDGDDRPPRLFYTLPYQASMNAMRRRLEETFGGRYVEIQHGRALLATYRWLMEKGESPQNAARVARERGNLARLHLPPVRVFSPYQILKAMYQLKGYEAQLTDYHDGLFIFDEIHAYNIPRLALILRTIAYLRRHYNARFLIMSATFPKLIRGWLAEALGETHTVVATPEVFADYQRHCIRLIEGEVLDPVNLTRIRDAAQAEGKSVLVVCNVVARAQQVYDYLQDALDGSGIKVLLLHGRFNMRDRQDKERTIQERTGASEKANAGLPTVLVATQAVEVSLDIDLDTIYSEPAPLEALVQRFGRVNRRGKKGIVDVHVFTVPSEQQKHIYDERLVAATLRILIRENGQAIDESAVEVWLNEIYAGEIEEEWRREYAQCAAEFDDAIVGTLRPFQSNHDTEERFDKMFDGLEVLPAGEDDKIQIEFEATRQAGHAIEAGELLVPISFRQYAQIGRAGRLWARDKGEWPIVISVPYSPEKGLDMSQLTARLNEEEEPGI